MTRTTKTTKMISTTDSVDYETDPYFNWLCEKVGIGQSKQYYILAWALHKQFTFEPGNDIETDKNRAQDGLELRVEFMRQHGEMGSAINRGPCSMLEFLIGLAKRMSFIMCDDEADVDEKAGYFFWKLVRNMQLLKFNDFVYQRLNGDFFVQEAVDRILFRTFEYNGEGGLFPLRGDYGDQRRAEIWYQMQFWLREHSNL